MKSALSILPINDGQATSCSSVAVNINEPQALDGRVVFAGRAAVVTLGCAKNQVDSEVMIGVLRNSGFEIVNELSRADVAIINTCGFLESAVKESVDCVLELSELKKSGSLRRLLVAGCMVERYKGDIRKALPEVDSFISLDGLLSVGQAALGTDDSLRDILHEGARPYFLYDDTMPRHLASRRHMAYVKVSEGCNRPCAFCIIPQIRGAMRSRSIESVAREVQALGAQGVREINLVAQDLTAFGNDNGSGRKNDNGSGRLVDLLRTLDDTKAMPWIRLLYAYPVGVDDELLAAIMDLPSVCEYLDVPLQHASEDVLKAMKRPIGRYGSRRFVEYVRSKANGIKLRTTFIVGFPGETEQDIQDLENFVADGHFESVGVFTYSPEQGTAAFDMKDQISEKEKRARRDRVMLAQQKVRVARNMEYIGQELDVLVEGPHEETEMLLSARTRFQAPEVDGSVLINDVVEGLGTIEPGHMGRLAITEISGYDLVGTLIA